MMFSPFHAKKGVWYNGKAFRANTTGFSRAGHGYLWVEAATLGYWEDPRENQVFNPYVYIV